jgi:hypothetical protein
MNKLLALFILLWVASSCVERIEVTLDETYTRLVVDGYVATDTNVSSVTLTHSSDYFYNQPSPPVTGAQVTINDGSVVIPLVETKPGISGIYLADSSFMGEIGKTYTLEVQLEEAINGKTDYSASCRMMSVARLDSISFEFQPDWGKEGFWLIKIYAQEPADEINYYLLRYYRNGVLKTDSIKKYVVSDDKYFNGSYINGLTAFYIDEQRTWETLHPGDTIMVQMSGITKEYYDFIMEVQIAGFNIPFFTGPPANVQGNIDNGAIGFFSAYSNSWAKGVVK